MRIEPSRLVGTLARWHVGTLAPVGNGGSIALGDTTFCISAHVESLIIFCSANTDWRLFEQACEGLENRPTMES